MAKAKIKPKAKPKMKAAKAQVKKPKSAAKPKAKAAKKASPAKKLNKKVAQKTQNVQKPKVVSKNTFAQIKPAAKQKLADVSDFVTPLDDRMIVQIGEGEKITPGGLIIPDTVSSVSGNREGTVLSVGRGHRDKKGRLRPMDVRSGDKIIFAEYAGSKLDYQGHNLVILRETDVMGVLN